MQQIYQNVAVDVQVIFSSSRDYDLNLLLKWPKELLYVIICTYLSIGNCKRCECIVQIYFDV